MAGFGSEVNDCQNMGYLWARWAPEVVRTFGEGGGKDRPAHSLDATPAAMHRLQ